ASADDPAFASFFRMQVDRQQVQQDRDALERVLRQAGDSGVSPEALAIVGSVQQNVQLKQALDELTTKQAELRALRYKYSDEYPLVQRRLSEVATLERQTIPTLARQLMAELSGREAELGRRVTADARSIQAVPPRAIDEARLQRQVTLAENLFTSLQKNYDEARLAEESAVPDARILDHAVVPQDPVRNTAPRVVFLGFAASLALGLCGAVVLDRIDPKVRYPDQVSRGLGIPILGAVPHLRNLPRGGRGNGARVPDDVNEVVEALRGVCLNLVYAHGGRAPLLVTITSPGAGDGKSFISANLAHTFADGGHRTLLIDADIRRGVLHRRLSVRRRPGLSDFLRGEAQLDAIVQATQFPALSLIGCRCACSERCSTTCPRAVPTGTIPIICRGTKRWTRTAGRRGCPSKERRYRSLRRSAAASCPSRSYRCGRQRRPGPANRPARSARSPRSRRPRSRSAPGATARLRSRSTPAYRSCRAPTP